MVAGVDSLKVRTSSILMLDLALVSKNMMPYSSASALPLAKGTLRLASMSLLLPTRTLMTLSDACCSMLRIQLRMLEKLASSVTSYTNKMPIAPR